MAQMMPLLLLFLHKERAALVAVAIPQDTMAQMMPPHQAVALPHQVIQIIQDQVQGGLRVLKEAVAHQAQRLRVMVQAQPVMRRLKDI
jgi:hypothetical protein